MASSALFSCIVVVTAGATYAGAAADPASPRPTIAAGLAKLDTGLRILASAEANGETIDQDTGKSSGGSLSVRSAAQLSASDEVLVDVYVDGSLDQTAEALRDLGMRVRAVSHHAPQRMVEGWLPVSSLTEAAALDETRALLTVPEVGTNEGSVLSQGDAAHNGPAARALGTTGAGVKVGVISDSINRVGTGVAGSQATGNLPGPASTPPGSVTVLLDGPPGRIDEGRAMAEIIFDTAPGMREMYFTTGTEGAATRASGIDNLVANGVKVIADDTFQITEPFFQDGVVAQAVDRARAAGVSYLVSAGNRARQSWEGTYRAMTDPRGVSASANDFDPGAGADAIQTIGTFTNRNMFIALQWDEAWSHATTDLAVDVFSVNGGVPSYEFTEDADNIATGLPSEFVGIMVNGTATIAISVRRKTGTRSPFIKYVVGGTQTFTIAEYATNSDAIDPDAASARGALTVAASNWATPATPESFSSRGGSVTKFFDTAGNRLSTPEVRIKPDLAAADAVATSVPGFNPFFGTSAAAPSAAGIAALIRAANPAMPVSVLNAILTNPANATDCTLTAGQPDADCGSGFIRAEKAVTQAKDTTPPTVKPVTSPASPNGKRGWFIGNVGLTWSITDTGSPAAERTNCSRQTISSNGIRTIKCTARSAGGAASATVTIKRDASKPSKPKFKGIKKTYTSGARPKKSKVKCTSRDAQSKIFKCRIKGFSTARGTHKLTAIATNGAGLTKKATFKYTIK